MKPIIPLVVFAALSACSMSSPYTAPTVELPIPDFEPELLDFDDVEMVPLSDYSYSDFGGSEDPETYLMELPDLEDKLSSLEMLDVSLSDIARKIVVEDARLSLIFAVEEVPTSSFSGSNFTSSEALEALEDLVLSHDLNFRRSGSIILISDGTSTNAASGYTRVYRTNAKSVAETVTSLFEGVNAQSVGRAVAVSGSSSKVTEALELIQDLDRDTVSSLPWAVVRVSQSVADKAESIVTALSEEEDPLSVTVQSVEGEGLVLLVGHNRSSVDEAKAVLLSLESGRPKLVSKTLPLADAKGAVQAIEGLFKNEVENNALYISSSSSELLLRGMPEAVSAAYTVAKTMQGSSDYIEVRAVIAETVRGSSVDRAFSIGGTSGSLGFKLNGSSENDLISINGGGFGAALKWLDRDSDTQLLATPRLSVRSGGDADLSVGSQIPISGSSVVEDGKTTQSTEYRDTGIILRISPVMLSDGRISVSLYQEISTAGTNALTNIDSPVFDQRKLTTDLILEPGELVAAGGLDYTTAENQSSGVMRMNPSGSSSARKLVVLLSADVATKSKRTQAVQDALTGLSDILRMKGG